MSSDEEDDQREENLSSDEPSSPMGTGLITQSRGQVPNFVFTSYFLVVLLQGFIYSSVLLRITPFVQRYMNISEKESTVVAQIFLLIDCLAPIFGGLVSDLAYTRYSVIFATSSTFFVSYALTIPLAYRIDVIPPKYRGYPFGVLLFVGQASSGIMHAMLVAFGIDQLKNAGDERRRRSLVRWNIWFCKLGHCLSMPFFVVTSEFSLLPTLLILAASALEIPLFVVWKRYYKLNTNDGWVTLKHLRSALRRAAGYNDDDDDDSVDVSEQRWILEEATPVSDAVKRYQMSLLRHFLLLIIIFFTFGAFWNANFMAEIVFPIQVRQMISTDALAGIQFHLGSIITALVLIPALDLFYRKFELSRFFTNFLVIGIGMTIVAGSILMATVNHALYGKIRTPSRSLTKDSLMLFQFVLQSCGEILFLTAGFDTAYTEGPPYLKGTAVGLFFGLGSVFGATIFAIYYSIKPVGVNQNTDAYVMVLVILLVTIVFMYTPAVVLYKKAKLEFCMRRDNVDAESRDTSINFRSID